MVQIANILYPTDFSDLSLHAMKYATFLCEKLGATLHCLHVVDDSYLQYWLAADMPAMPVGPPVEEVMAAGRKQLEEFVAAHAPAGVKVVQAVRRGRPFLEIINHAREKSVDLVVMGTHGRTALRQVLMGSVADKVLHKSPCPVMTVRSPKHPFEMP
jgi:nucleotide-binding universal stress UspA family protein